MKIGFLGEMASGKTHLASYILQKYGGQKISFADALKQDVAYLGLTIDGKIEKPRDRSVLQDYGQLRRGDLKKFIANGHILENNNGCFYIDDEYAGLCHKNYWLQQGLDKINSLEGNVVVDDIRLGNEVKGLMDAGFVIMRVWARECTRVERLIMRDGGYNPADFQNVSETQAKYLPVNYFLDNDNSFEECVDVMETILKNLGLV